MEYLVKVIASTDFEGQTNPMLWDDARTSADSAEEACVDILKSSPAFEGVDLDGFEELDIDIIPEVTIEENGHFVVKVKIEIGQPAFICAPIIEEIVFEVKEIVA